MKSLISVLLAATSCLAALHAQQGQPFYLLYNTSCMNQLEYRYTYKNVSMVSYSVRPNADEMYVLTAGGQNITTTRLPSNTVRCQDLNNYDNFLAFVNAQRNTPVYIVYQTPEGYTMTEITAAYKITRQGSYYILQAKDFSFALDTLRPNTGVNLALDNSSSFVFLSGQKMRGCLNEYSFRRESFQANQEKTDFDFIPGIGITNDRTGLNAAQAENNQVRLVGINGRYLDDHIAVACQNRPVQQPSTLSQWTNPITYTTDSRVQPEYDKETMSLIRKTEGPIEYDQTGLPPLADCPEPPGEGYHIVQPGENLNAIARTYEVPLKDVLTWNKIKDADRIQTCQKIWVVKPPAGAVTDAGKSAKPATYSTAAKSGPTVQHQGVYWKTGGMTAKSTQTTQSIIYFSPNKTTPTPLNTAQNPIHIVKAGETLYSIARYYALTEEKLRSLNGLPLQGDVLLRPGDQLLICECKTADDQPAPDPARYNYYDKMPAPGGNPVNSLGVTLPATDDTRPAGYDYQQPADSRPVFDDRVPVSGKDKPAAGQTPGATRTPVYQEYYVRQGDTLGSIAVQFRVSADELALINNKQVNESLIAGQRILIPKY